MMQKTETKVVKKYGNSGGIYLPSSWIGGRVEISLVSRPPEPGKDLPLAFAERMQHIVSILVYGSYATGEYATGSDIDVIVVTDNHIKGMKVPEELRGMNYDIRIMAADEIRRLAGRDILLSKSLEDAKAILNDSFLDELRSIRPKGSLRERIDLAKSSLGIMKSIFETGGTADRRRQETPSSSDYSGLVYPLMMRIKEMLLMECAMDGRKYSLKLLENRILAKGVSKPDYRKLMAEYRAVRDGKNPEKREFGGHVFMLLLELLEEMIGNAEKKEKA